MQMQPILGCALNLSEGRRQDVIELAAAQAASATPVLDVSSDADHNRTVLTMAGPPGRLIEAVVRVGRIALENIDLAAHAGVHPRTGAVDVVPFYPARNASMDDAVAAARACAERLWQELALPVFLYEEAAVIAAARSLPWIRKHGFAGHSPDVGRPHPHPSAGAVVVGARGLLVAYNVDLATDDSGVAASIAAKVRSSYPARLRALGLYLQSRGTAQVSTNILDPERLTLTDVYLAVLAEARKAGVEVQDSEIVGLVPRACLNAAHEDSLKLRETPKILEELLEELVAPRFAD